MDAMSYFHLFSRWMHVIAGIAWIGMLYFFNFVNIPLQGSVDDATKKGMNPQLMPPALWWFRWGAMFTFLFGLVLFWINYIHTSNLLEAGGGVSSRGWWIMWGMLFGTVMWFNVWFIIWPAQKKLLGGTAGDAAPALRKRAGLFSKINTILSGPMLFGMLAAAHPQVSSGGWAAKVVLFTVGLLAIHLAYWQSRRVTTKV